ncbi:hypothetical protein GGR50DRAFT_458297 [Xylaria sp. CBS 124048]|nr:hypothetical protein GGR50DRAFT_458297 [Xylaria sp. CBS 124048]
MSKVHKPGPDQPPDLSRSDKFVRMLELEKMYKMRRFQHDNASSSLTNNPPRANPPSTVANPPLPRSRRASDYPPLSNQPQIMKINRRSAALPSLSVSIPPSPTQALAVGSDESVGDISPAKQEHNRTVTFSDPEDEELSEQSSICQSPSWEGWNSRKKKKAKKGDNLKGTKEKDDTAIKRRSNRLVKPAPTSMATPKQSTTPEPAGPPVDSGTSVRPDRMSIPLKPEVQAPTSRPQSQSNAVGSGANDGRPRSRGFLSGFRSEHGNMSAMRGFMGVRKGAGKGTDENGRAVGAQSDPTHTPPPNATRPGMEKPAQKSKKPPSVRSMISGSEQSLSSQERRGSGTRPSSSSDHGRSQSLLSSTLNKMRGSSFFNYHPAGDSPANKSSNNAGNSQVADNVHNETLKVPGEGPSKIRLTHLEDPQQSAFDFPFASSMSKVNMEPGPDIAPRGRQPRSRKVEVTSSNSEQNIADPNPSGNPRIKVGISAGAAWDNLTAMNTSEESQSQGARAPQQDNQRSKPISRHPGGSEVSGGKPDVSQSERADAYRAGNMPAVVMNSPETERMHKEEEDRIQGTNRRDRLDINDSQAREDDRFSVRTYKSTARPISRYHNDAIAKDNRPQDLTGANGSEAHIQPNTSDRLQVWPDTAARRSVGESVSPERDGQEQVQPQRDYFEFFSDTYVPPPLDLRSPNENGRDRSPRFPLADESDEDSGSSNTDNRFVDSRTRPKLTANEGARKIAHARHPHSRDSGRPSTGRNSRDSPHVSIQFSNGDAPTLERLGISSKAAKALGEARTTSSSTNHSHQHDPSRATSERSSSSTYDDSPPSPSSVTTPDSSRPQSRKGAMISNPEASQITSSETVPQTQAASSHRAFRDSSSDRREDSASRKSRAGMDANNGGSRQSGLVPGLQQRPAPPFARVGSWIGTPSPGTTPTSGSFADCSTPEFEETSEQDTAAHPAPPPEPRAQSVLDLNSATKLIPRALRPQRLQLKPSAVSSSVSLPVSSASGSTEDVAPRRPGLKSSANSSMNGSEQSTTVSAGGAYLQEARKAAPLVTASSSRALRPPYNHKNSSGNIKGAVSVGYRAEPLAKMLVECCSCHFFHDMPSRVYECIAKPDSIVEDKSLGVSATIGTIVRCPWCAHGMTSQCCAGYAAVVYLQEKLHGK